jgi:hypothetical protein
VDFRVDKSLKAFQEKWQTAEKKGSTTTSILQLQEWPEDLDDEAKLMCAVFNGDDVVAKSEQITILSHGKLNLSNLLRSE